MLGFAYAPKVLALAEKLVLALPRAAGAAIRSCARSSRRLPARLQARADLERLVPGAAARRTSSSSPMASREITPRGVRTVDGARARGRRDRSSAPGSRSATTCRRSAIVGSGGVELNDAWRRALRNYLGITVSGFPNLFLLMGPNTGLGHNSMIFMIEAQARYAAQAHRGDARRSALASIDVRPEVERALPRRARAQDEEHRVDDRLPELVPDARRRGVPVAAQRRSTTGGGPAASTSRSTR